MAIDANLTTRGGNSMDTAGMHLKVFLGLAFERALGWLAFKARVK